MSTQYYVTVEVKSNSTVEIVRVDDYPSLELAHHDASEHVSFLRRVGQRRPPHGKLETRSLPRALLLWPGQVLRAVAGAGYGFLGDETMSRGLKPLDNNTDALVAAVNRCALNEAGDADRILLAHAGKRLMLGPGELVECDRHPGEHALHRWTWDPPGDGDHVRAIETSSDPEIVSSCPKCVEEDNRDDE